MPRSSFLRRDGTAVHALPILAALFATAPLARAQAPAGYYASVDTTSGYRPTS